MSKVTFTEEFTQDQILKMFYERYVDFEETEVILDKMDKAKINMKWTPDGGIFISITESENND